MLKGQGLLSLWNGFDPARRDEYDLWHTRQHVPERLGVPGMLRARRYDGGHGALPEFLTLYELTSSAVLSSAPYRQLLDNPTPWSRSMRPSFGDFFRVGHQVVLSRGGGVGSALLVTTFDGTLDPAACAAVADAVLQATAATALHFVAKDPAVEPVPFAVAGAGYPDAAAIMVESYRHDMLDRIAPALDTILDRHGVARGRAWTRYRLAYALEREELAQVVPIEGPGNL
jgi:hypothetical protein